MSESLNVVYTHPITRRRHIWRRRSAPNVNLYTARKVLELMDRCYQAQFESKDFKGPSGPLPAGTIDKYFRPNDTTKALKQVARMNRYIREGSTYWTLNPLETEIKDDEIAAGGRYAFLAGLAKTSPSKASLLQKLGVSKPNCFINDLAVDPAWGHHEQSSPDSSTHQLRIGTMALHVALKFGGYSPSKTVALHAYEGSDINSWYRRIGLAPHEGTEGQVPVASDQLPLEQTLYVSQEGRNIGTHIEALERQTPWLAKAEAA